MVPVQTDLNFLTFSKNRLFIDNPCQWAKASGFISVSLEPFFVVFVVQKKARGQKLDR